MLVKAIWYRPWYLLNSTRTEWGITHQGVTYFAFNPITFFGNDIVWLPNESVLAHMFMEYDG